MLEVIYGVFFFVIVVIALVIVILLAKRALVASGDVTITINEQKEIRSRPAESSSEHWRERASSSRAPAVGVVHVPSAKSRLSKVAVTFLRLKRHTSATARLAKANV